MEQTIWYIVRAMGVTAYVLLFATVATGLMLSGPGGAWWKGMPINALHRFITWLMGAFLAVHVVLLLFISFAPLTFGPLEILVPFTSNFEPFWTGVGVLAVYMIVIVIVTTTVVRRQLHNLVWYGLHLLSYPAFVFASAHGIKDGHDTRAAWMLAIYTACTAVVALIVAVRFTKLSAVTDDQVRRWGPGVLAGGALSVMVLVLLGTRLG